MRRGAALLASFFFVSLVAAQDDGRERWALVDARQSACLDAFSPTATFRLSVRGVWMEPLQVGVVDLPAGSRVSVSDTEIGPGGSNGGNALASIEIDLPQGTPPGDYRAVLWAHEKGEPRRTVPLHLAVRNDCNEDRLRRLALEAVNDAP